MTATPVQSLRRQAAETGGDVVPADVDRGPMLARHSDVQDSQVPPSAGGSTYWANPDRACGGLDETAPVLVDSLEWLPTSTQATACGVGMQAVEAQVEKRGLKLECDARHPVARTHPMPRREALRVSTFTVRVVGREDPDADESLTLEIEEYIDWKHLWPEHGGTMSRLPFGMPDRWSSVADSEELAVGEVESLHDFGADLAIDRGQDGTAAVLDAYCARRGAHLRPMTPIGDETTAADTGFLLQTKALEAALVHPMLDAYPKRRAGALDQDIPIREAKRFRPAPALREGIGPIGEFRRSTKQFYPGGGSEV